MKNVLVECDDFGDSQILLYHDITDENVRLWKTPQSFVGTLVKLMSLLREY